jgi:hypothetical protein
MFRIRATALTLVVLVFFGLVIPVRVNAQMIQPQQSTQPSLAAGPHVTSVGMPVTASGNCQGSARLTVTGGAAGWYDIPPVYLDELLFPEVTGDFSASFPMPPSPSTVVLWCTQGLVTQTALMLISPSNNVMSLVGDHVGTGVAVTIPNLISPERLAAFTATGQSVPMTVVANGMQVLLWPSLFPVRIVIVGIESLGENANALQNSRVQGWSVDVGALTDGVSTLGFAPAVRLSLLG